MTKWLTSVTFNHLTITHVGVGLNPAGYSMRELLRLRNETV